MAEEQAPWEYTLRKYLLLLASLVATVAYGAGFSPPGGIWQKDTTNIGGSIAGDPIIRNKHYGRYLVFFYCNATAFALSLVVIVLVLLFATLHEKKISGATVMPLRVVMVLDLISLIGAYAAGACLEKTTTTYTAVLVGAVFVYVLLHKALPSLSSAGEHDLDDAIKEKERSRKVLLLLATFATSLTYVAGLSTPGGFWSDTVLGFGGHRAGEAIMQEHHLARLKAFLICNTTAFVASLLIIVLLLDKKLRERTVMRSWELYGCIVIALVALIGAYAAGSSRVKHTTVNVIALVGAVLVYIALQMTIVPCAVSSVLGSEKLVRMYYAASKWRNPQTQSVNDREKKLNEALEKARSLVLLLATLAATITYQAALNPPGGYWQDDKDGHKAGDPILLTTNPKRYKVFFYCNSTAFVASLLAIILVENKALLKRHTLEAAMILDSFGLMGAYAAGSCRDESTSIKVMAIAGVVLVYVVVHIVFFTLDGSYTSGNDDALLEKRRKRLLLFAILAATITYQAGLTPPSGYWQANDEQAFTVRRKHDNTSRQNTQSNQMTNDENTKNKREQHIKRKYLMLLGILAASITYQGGLQPPGGVWESDGDGHNAGNPILRDNQRPRYRVFFYSNSTSFVASIIVIVMLLPESLNERLSGWLMKAMDTTIILDMIGLLVAYGAGSSRDWETSGYVIAMALFVLGYIAIHAMLSKLSQSEKDSTSQQRVAPEC
ncbi:hypothetical protein GUJ93_ZPchr0006g41237 [Zizania palustris]|uniref:PGG domain-containing protein n=1 Tax=Zizania palustris TaxID=103762 RepID=A0A8J5VX61_ZIZPA|nr:hypothetical protein GUJ93_ZPchr0006g41237 [Zizania palustris]